MKRNKTTHFVTGVLMLLFVGAFLILAGRFLYIQATGEIDNVSLEKWAHDKRLKSSTLNAERGKIFDSNGMMLAYDRPTFRVYAVIDEEYTVNSAEPNHVVDVEKTADKLASALDVDEAFIIDMIEKGLNNDRAQVEFGKAGKELNQKTKDKISEFDLPGIHFEKESIRYYPNGLFASHIIGFARMQTEEKEDKENKGITGEAGIEREMDELLSGKDGYISYQRDKFDRKLLNPEEVVKSPENGKDIHLTIDQKVQTLLEDAMSEAENKYEPERITAAVMHAKTGEVIAMSNRPSYNPNRPSDVQNWYNDVISTPFEPGSTVKMFTWAAAIDAGVYKGDEWYDSGKYQVNEQIDPIRDHNNGEGWGSITFDEGFERSSNVAAAKLAWEKLGTEDYFDYLQAFDFDEKSGIDLPGEVPGEILYNWPLEKITTSFGQGSTLTPIQQMKAATAISNGGKMLEPYVIKKIVDPVTNEVIKENSAEVVGEPISVDTADQVIDLLDTVVNGENGTGKPYKLDDYSLIGKTGTSQIPNPEGGYLKGHNSNIFSFLGMAPKDDPQLIMYVSVSQPKLSPSEKGSSPVSFIFKNVMDNGLHYLNIDPDKDDEEKPIETIELPNIIEKNVTDTEEKLKKKGLQVTVIGSGKKIKDASFNENDKVLASDRIILLTDKPNMPDVLGWSQRDVLQLGNLLDIEVEAKGNGYVTKQNIEKGKSIKEDDKLIVELEVDE